MSNDIECLVNALVLAAEANEQWEREERYVESLVCQRDELLDACITLVNVIDTDIVMLATKSERAAIVHALDLARSAMAKARGGKRKWMT